MRCCVIPARGGSKRIPGKNIKIFFGKPIIAYSIKAALAASSIDHVIVSTDDEKIAEVARAAGAEVPFSRPADLSDDHATTTDVIAHAIDWFSGVHDTVEAICCLYATAPFVRAADLDAAWTKMRGGTVDDQPDFVFSATEYAFPVQRAFAFPDGELKMLYPEHELTRSQDLRPTFHDAGQFYWCAPDAIAGRRPVFSSRSLIYEMPRDRVQDIDTLQDWAFAEKLYELQACQ